MKIKIKLIMLMILVAALVGSSCSLLSKNDAPNAVKDGIKLLEAQEYEKFLDRFMSPEDKAKIKPDKKFADDFGKNKAGEVLILFNKIKDRKPEYNEDKTVATYKFDGDEDVKNKKPLILKKTNDVWHINN